LSRWTGWSPIDVAGLDAALQPMGTGRGAELHLGTILREMKRAAGENVESIPGEQEWLRAQVGFLYEVAVEYVIAGMSIDDALELAFKRHMRALRVMSRQVKLERDGVHMTPDGLDAHRLYSWKATWRGAGKAGFGRDLEEGLRDFEDNFWPWHMAEQAYAAAAQHAGLLPKGDATCRFEVLWVRGDYRGAGGPKALACEVTWGPEEMDANWAVILRNKERMGR
jgi:hypothetical protein